MDKYQPISSDRNTYIDIDNLDISSERAFYVTHNKGNKNLFKLTESGGMHLWSDDETDKDVNLLNVEVTGSPIFSWDESEDAFAMNKGLDINVNSSSVIPQLRIKQSGAGDTSLLFEIPFVTGYVMGIDNSQGSDVFSLEAGVDQLSGNYHFTMNGSGNVGIGIASAANKLDVIGDVVSRPSTGNHNGSVKLSSTSTNGYLEMQDTSGNTDVHIDTNGDSYFNGGDIGIGTNSPTFNILGSASPGLDISGSSPSLVFHDTDVTVEGQIFMNSTGINIDSAGATTASGNNNIIFRTENDNSSYSPTERMRIDRSGNVGIGTTNPLLLFHVSKSISGYIAEIRNENSSAGNGLVIKAGVDSGDTAFIASNHNASTDFFRLLGDGSAYFYQLPTGSTQANAGAGVDELWVTSGHATLPNNVVMIGV